MVGRYRRRTGRDYDPWCGCEFVGVLLMAHVSGDQRSTAGWAYFLAVALGFLALAVWHGATGSIGVGIAFAALGVILAVFAMLKRRDARRRGR